MSARPPYGLLVAAASESPVIMPFRFESHEVRVMVGQDGEPWFVAMEIATILDYSETEAMTRKLDSDEKQTRQIVGFGPRGITVINEPGLYSCVLTSQKPEAKRFKRWVTHEVLPAIRKTGSYSAPARVLTPAEMFLQNAQMMVDIEQRQLAQDVKIDRMEQRVGDLADSMLMLARPAGAESIVHIRDRINKLYGLPPRIVDLVLRQSPIAPKPAGMVKHSREEALGGSYAVYWTKDVSAVFARFVAECTRVTATQATHQYIEGRFKMAAPAERGPSGQQSLIGG